MAESQHWRLQLNNLLQRSYGTSALSWEQKQLGSQHAGTWEATALIRFVPYGRGRGRTVGEAREAAAQQAYAALHNELNGRR
ncbi:hypothetical protein EIP91_004859 [Steccherinum ochraceum]|uniref:DRBM domain-containing protein n=1 Tax=Steccherinum ochraceum TaxID=92696 RepID=A0A4R0RMW8_9APHY|nr:hypothetical protein EIP91_004859 [Steccherinum ochraceum]